MMEEITPEQFNDVFDQLERNQIRYVVVSGVAVVLHGHVRPLADLDLVIDPAPAEANRAMNALMSLGFYPSIPLPLSAVTVLRMFDQRAREVDVFVKYHIPFVELLADSILMDVGNSLVRVISLAHLMQVKSKIGREHDLLDVAGLATIKEQ
jgi:hypothetical protein